MIGKVNFETANTFLFGGALEESCDVHLNETHLIWEETSQAKSIHGNLTRWFDITYSSELRVSGGKLCENLSSVNETFRIWMTKYGAFLWSCFDSPENNSHDEGMMVLMDTNEYTVSWFSSNLEKTLADANSIIRNYFSEALLEAIKWEDVGEHIFCKLQTLPPRMPLYQKSIIVVIFLIIACCIFKYYLCKRQRGDQVVPIE